MDKDVIVASSQPQNESTTSPNTLWNEGRVVGYSAYEIYVRQHTLEDPNTEPASEREWLAASLGSGASMLVRIPKQAVAEGQDNNILLNIPFPEATTLCAANTIVASFFQGEGELLEGNNYFARNVKSYGNLISNTSDLSPLTAFASSDGYVSSPEVRNLPHKQLADWSKEDIAKLRDYMRILDGVILQPGTWRAAPHIKSDSPHADFIPELVANADGRAIYPTLRLHIQGPTEHDFWILLTGFTMRAIASGESKYDTGSVVTDRPYNGDFLGPETYPWANKVVFTVPTIAIRSDHLYKRSIAEKELREIDDGVVVDMRETDPASYYTPDHPSTVPLDVDKFVTLKDGSAVLTTYARSSVAPAALYGTLIDKNSQDQFTSKLYPIDTVAPGTIKLFHGQGEDVGATFENEIPDNYAIMRDAGTYVFNQVGPNNKLIPVAEVTAMKYTTGQGDYPCIAVHKTGTVNVKSVAIPPAVDGKGGEIEVDAITWDALLQSLATNKQVDVLGPYIRSIKIAIQQAIEDRIPDAEFEGLYVIKIDRNADGSLSVTLAPLTSTVAIKTTEYKYNISHDPGPQKWERVAVAEALSGEIVTSAVSLQDTTGKYFDLATAGYVHNPDVIDPSGGTPIIPVPNHSLLDWDILLQSLNKQKPIDVLGKSLRNIKEAMIKAHNDSKFGSYNINISASGISISPTATFQTFIEESIRLVPQAQSDKIGPFFDTMTLDIFGYTETITSMTNPNSKFDTANMICNLICKSADRTMGKAANGYCQAFTIYQEDLQNWYKIYDWCNNIAKSQTQGFNEDQALPVIFTCGGRPMYQDADPNFRGYPKAELMVVAYMSRAGRGVLYGYSRNWGWGKGGAIASAAFQGALAIAEMSMPDTAWPYTCPLTPTT